jgi:hypothetical protein
LYRKTVRTMMSMTSSIRCDLGSMFASSQTTQDVPDVLYQSGVVILC